MLEKEQFPGARLGLGLQFEKMQSNMQRRTREQDGGQVGHTASAVGKHRLDRRWVWLSGPLQGGFSS